MELLPARYEQLTLFDVAEYIGKTILNRWDDMGNYITVFEHGHVETYDRYGPLGDGRSIAVGDDW